MELAREDNNFSSACEHILSVSALNRLLTTDEATVIHYYCAEVTAKVEPLLPKSTT